MKIEFVEIAGFRAFRDKTRFRIPQGFAVFSGRNGVGKSTVLDAIDFALTGTINKFFVKEAKGGGLDRHLWWLGHGKSDGHYVSVGFVNEDGRRFEIKRSRDRGYESADVHIGKELSVTEFSAGVTAETVIQTTLIRDELISSLSLDLPEQARFAAVRAAIGGIAGPDLSTRTDAILKAAEVAKTQQAVRIEEAKSELGRALTALTEARSTAQRSTNVAEALQLIESLQLSLPTPPNERIEAIRNLIADRKTALKGLQDVQKTFEDLLKEQAYFSSETGKQESKNALGALATAQKEAELVEHTLALAKKLFEAERQNDIHASHLAALIEHGSALGLEEEHCPLCRAIRTTKEFSQAIEFTRRQLASQGERLSKASIAVTQAQSALEAASTKVASARQRLVQFEGRRNAVDAGFSSIKAVYLNYKLNPPTDLSEAKEMLLREQESILQLERAIFILEASSAVDLVKTIEGRISSLRQRIESETAKYAKFEKTADLAKQIDTASKSIGNEILAEQFDTVMPLVKELYRRLRPHGDWTEIEADFGGKVRASLNFLVGDGYNPQFLFSSGQRRAAGLAFLLSVHLSRPWCRWNTLMLDDPVQHIDDYRALNLVEVLAAIRRTGRQIMIAVEDAALADVLCRRLRSDANQFGRRFELDTSAEGTAEIVREEDVYPMPQQVLQILKAS